MIKCMMYPYEDTITPCGAKAHFLIVRSGNPPNLTFACDPCKDHYVKGVRQIAEAIKCDTSNIELYRLEEENIL